jgi:Helix-turn-helix domain
MEASSVCLFEPLIDAESATKLLCVHVKTLYRMCNDGIVPCMKQGKYWQFRASVLDEWVSGQLESDHQSRRVN